MGLANKGVSTPKVSGQSGPKAINKYAASNAFGYSMKEKEEISIAYNDMLSVCGAFTAEEKEQVDAAFWLAFHAHEQDRRKSGEAYILHPIAVARIVAEEIGLNATSIVCALLHDVVEDTQFTIKDLRTRFGDEVAAIVDGLTKLTGMDVPEDLVMKKAANFRKLLFALAKDVRVILIKLADRLHNLRTLGSMRKDKQERISNETLYLYTPIAHRLGLYRLKSEMEDLCMKYTETAIYYQIKEKLNAKKQWRDEYVKRFIAPIQVLLKEDRFPPFRILGRPKHIFSIINKIKNKKVTFEEIYDLFAIRIIIDAPLKEEKKWCWQAFANMTKEYNYKTDRIRDWITNPRTNGYESLHITVMGPEGKWVEVQIRTERMDAIAERGIAAHWRYKGGQGQGRFDVWLQQVRDMLSSSLKSDLELLTEFRRNVYKGEVFVFTPTGDLRCLRANATVLDFAFDIHTAVGCKCTGAVIDGKHYPISHPLKNGDQVKIITQKKQKPSQEWLNFTVTSKARHKIKSVLKAEMRAISEQGKEILERKLRNHKDKVTLTNNVLNELVHYYKFQDSLDFCYAIATEKFDLAQLKQLNFAGEKIQIIRTRQRRDEGIEGGEFHKSAKKISQKDLSEQAEINVFGGFVDKVDYSIASCCNPVAGDSVFGFLTIGKGIRIHHNHCTNAKDLKTRYPYRVVNVKWGRNGSGFQTLTHLKINGKDKIGLVNQISNIISNDMKINMRSITFGAEDGVFQGDVQVYVQKSQELKSLTKKLLAVDGIYEVRRLH